MRLRWPGLVVDLERRSVEGDGGAEALTALEAELLRHLAERAGRAVSTEEILTQVWGYRSGVETRAVSGLVLRLRRKIEPNVAEPTRLATVRGFGYRLDLGDGVVEPEREASPAPTLRLADVPRPTGDQLIGRQDLVARVVESLTQGAQQVVTLHGPGGVGKTRVAQAVFDAVRSSGAAARWCHLADARDDAGLAHALVRDLDLRFDPGQDPSSARLAPLLAGLGPTVVVLDNTEQITRVVDGALAIWVRNAPAVRWLVTTREVLAREEERRFEVAPLQTGDAVRLLRARWGTLEDEPLETLEALVGVLDGIPLAIELAAARGRVLSPKDLLARLARQLDVLGDRSSRRVERQATLRNVIAWSWDLLGQDEQEALVALGQFPAAFTLDQAEGVIGSDRAIDLVEALLDKSLVRTRTVDGARRYELFEAVRAFVGERPRAPHAAARFAATLARWAEPTEGLLDAAAERDLVRDRGALEVAHAWACAAGSEHADTASQLARALGAIAEARGEIGVATRRIEHALGGALSPNEEVLARLHLGRLLALRGESAKALATFRAALLLSDADRAMRAWLEVNLGKTEGLSGDLAEGIPHLRQGIEGLRSAGGGWRLGRALSDLGLLLTNAGDLRDARSVLVEAKGVAEEAGDQRAVAAALGNLARLVRIQADLPTAATYASLAVEVEERMGDTRLLCAGLALLGSVQHDLREFAQARVSLERALALLDVLGPVSNAPYVVGALAHLELDVGNLVRAHELAATALRRSVEAGQVEAQGWFQRLLGMVLTAQGDFDGAMEAFDRASALLGATGNPFALGWVELARAEVHLARGEVPLVRQAIARVRDSMSDHSMLDRAIAELERKMESP